MQNGDDRHAAVHRQERGLGRVRSATVSDLSVAPDGVRIAFVAQLPGATTSGLYLAAIGGGAAGGQASWARPRTHLIHPAGRRPSGRTSTHPASLAWYDADDLIALNATRRGNTLWEVPVDGQQAQEAVTPPDVTSITADGPANVLVAGLSGNILDVSTSLEGPWDPLGEPGQNPPTRANPDPPPVRASPARPAGSARPPPAASPARLRSHPPAPSRAILVRFPS